MHKLRINAAEATAWPNADHARAWMRNAVLVVAGNPEITVAVDDARQHDPNADGMFIIRVTTRFQKTTANRFVQLVDDAGEPVPVRHGSGIEYPDRYANGPHEDPCLADDDEVPGDGFRNSETAIIIETRDGWFVVPDDQPADADVMHGPFGTYRYAYDAAINDGFECIADVDASAVVVAATRDATEFPCGAAADACADLLRDRIKRDHGGAVLRPTGLSSGTFHLMVLNQRGALLGFIGATPGAEEIVKVAAEDLKADMILKVPDIGRWSEQDEPGRRETIDRVEWSIGTGGLDVVDIHCASGVMYRSQPWDKHPIIMPKGGAR